MFKRKTENQKQLDRIFNSKRLTIKIRLNLLKDYKRSKQIYDMFENGSSDYFQALHDVRTKFNLTNKELNENYIYWYYTLNKEEKIKRKIYNRLLKRRYKTVHNNIIPIRY